MVSGSTSMSPLGTSWDSLFVPNRMDLESILSISLGHGSWISMCTVWCWWGCVTFLKTFFPSLPWHFYHFQPYCLDISILLVLTFSQFTLLILTFHHFHPYYLDIFTTFTLLTLTFYHFHPYYLDISTTFTLPILTFLPFSSWHFYTYFDNCSFILDIFLDLESIVPI